MKKLIAGAAVLVAAVVVAVVSLWPVQRHGPEPIAYGRDACARCRMQISQAGFAGELRAADGALTKYDDIGCLLQSMARAHREFSEVWVHDHDSGDFIALLDAHLVRIQGGATPMGSGLVAFARQAAATAYAGDRGGTVVALEDVLKTPQRVALGPGAHPQVQAR